MIYLLLKLVHIISATLIFGTGLGSAFYVWRAHLSNDLHAMHFALRNVVIADWVFTTPAIIIQPITGLLLAYTLHLPVTTGWILLSLALYLLAGACWIPVVMLQIKMHKMLSAAVRGDLKQLPLQYQSYYRIWFILGWPAFIAVLFVFYLMVFKPTMGEL